MGQKANRKKVIVVGDGAVGKTFLIARYVHGDVPLQYTPTVFETQVTKVSYFQIISQKVT